MKFSLLDKLYLPSLRKQKALATTWCGSQEWKKNFPFLCKFFHFTSNCGKSWSCRNVKLLSLRKNIAKFTDHFPVFGKNARDKLKRRPYQKHPNLYFRPQRERERERDVKMHFFPRFCWKESVSASFSRISPWDDDAKKKLVVHFRSLSGPKLYLISISVLLLSSVKYARNCGPETLAISFWQPIRETPRGLNFNSRKEGRGVNGMKWKSLAPWNICHFPVFHLRPPFLMACIMRTWVRKLKRREKMPTKEGTGS